MIILFEEEEESTIANSIDDCLDSFLDYTYSSSPKEVYEMHLQVLAILRQCLNSHGHKTLLHHELIGFNSTIDDFCKVYCANRIVPSIEYFFLYYLYKEVQLTNYMRICFKSVIFRLMHWLYQYEELSDKDYWHTNKIFERISSMESKAMNAKLLLCQWLNNGKTQPKESAQLHYEQLEIIETLGENIWLAKSDKGFQVDKPIKLNRKLVDLFKPGWTIEGLISPNCPKPKLACCSDIWPTLPTGL